MNAVKILGKLTLAIVILVQAHQAIAETVYIRDVIYVPLRGGQSNEHRILHQGLRSGLVLERLEQNDDTGFSRVRTPGGLEGWIQNQYLVTEPIAAERVKTLVTEVESLTTQLESARQSLDTESASAQSAADEIAELKAERQALSNELQQINELAADVINIDQKNKQLQTEVSDLNQEIDDLAVVNASLRDSATQTWFMIGAGTIFLGLLLGFWVARQMYTRRDTGWT